ncbi:MAG: alpha/beta hydrolase [Novosphingobium sp.]|jgi:pimeloyl-ACP methyl ester carboxylesterase|nr:alpha/beta hydrolase [Novosphingobium sp.]
MTATIDQHFSVRRGFADVAHGQIHYRHAGSGPPLLAFHASPGSSRQLLRLIEDLAPTARVIAPDTPGNGDSPALSAHDAPIADLAAAMAGFLDSIGIDKVDLYGSHTGAAIASELAILAPERIGRVVLGGISCVTGAQLEEILAHYAFPFPADLDGAYLARVFQFCRDQYLFFPWYDRSRTARRDGGLGSAADLHALVVEVLKANETYDRNYRAAFQWDAPGRLPRVAAPTLVIAAENDPLLTTSAAMAQCVPDGRFQALPRLDAPDFRKARTAAMTAFLSPVATPA